MKGTKTMLEVKNITKYYNTVKAVDNLSFKVKKDTRLNRIYRPSLGDFTLSSCFLLFIHREDKWILF